MKIDTKAKYHIAQERRRKKAAPLSMPIGKKKRTKSGKKKETIRLQQGKSK